MHAPDPYRMPRAAGRTESPAAAAAAAWPDTGRVDLLWHRSAKDYDLEVG